MGRHPQSGHQPRLRGRDIGGGHRRYRRRAIPQLGFIHEHSGEAFALDVADLFRDTILLPAAFQSARAVMDNPALDIERHTRRTTGELLRTERVISKMIDRIKTIFDDVAVPDVEAESLPGEPDEE